MKLYRLHKLDIPEYGYVVYSASYMSPLDQLTSIERELERHGYVGPVVFDLLLSVGNSDTRFQVMHFDGQKLSLCSAKTLTQQKEEFRRRSAQFYQKNYDKLDMSILTKPTQFRIKRGLGA
jgi:hypothetical protein